MVERVDVPISDKAKHGLVVVVPVWRVVLVHHLIELVEYAKLEAVLDKERHDVLYGQSLLHILLCLADGLQEAGSCDNVPLLGRAQQVVLVEVIDTV